MENTELENANNFYKEGKYEESIKLYSELLENDSDNIQLLSNRSAANIKLSKFKKALKDAVKCTKLNSSLSKSWGRLGGALYGMGNYKESHTAYTKAYELEKLDIYKDMLNSINEKLKRKPINNMPFDKMPFENMPFENMPFNKMLDGNIVNTMLDNVMTNPNIMNKIIDPKFQEKMFSMQKNPMAALNDSEMMDIMKEMMKNVSIPRE